jgi:hypothetical protein
LVTGIDCQRYRRDCLLPFLRHDVSSFR